MKRIVFIFLLVSICSFLSYANDGSYATQGNGGAVIPVKNNSISMKKEEIKIDVRMVDFSNYSIEYDCTFYFTNTTDKTQVVLIGFPHKLDAHVGPDYKSQTMEFVSTPTESAIEDFKFYVEGREMGFNPMPANENPELKEVPAYDVVYTLELTFAPKERKTVRNTYRMHHWYDGYPSPMGPFAYFRSQYTIRYILKSGLTWKEPIGEADIWITFHVPENFITIKAVPEDFKPGKDPNQIHYQYKTFTPEEDLSISFFYKKLPPKKPIKQIKEYYDKKDYVTAYYLLAQWDCTSLQDEKDKTAKDTFRKLAYKTAEQLYRKDPGIRDLRGFNAYDVAKMHDREYTFVTDYKPYTKVIDEKTILIGSRDPEVRTARIRDYTIQDKRLYVLYEWGWIVFDISTMPDCHFLGEFFYKHSYDGALNKCAVIDDYLYAIGDNDAHLHIFDISGMEKPMEINSFKVNDCGHVQSSMSLLIRDNSLFISLGSCQKADKLVCYNIMDRKNPNPFPGNKAICGSLHVYKNFFITHIRTDDQRKSKLIMIDAENPSSIVGEAETKASSSAVYENEIYIYANKVFIPYYTGLEVFEINTDGKSPSLVKKTDITRPSDVKMTGNFFIRGVFIKDNIAYLNNFEYFIDISDLNALKYLKPEADENRPPLDNVLGYGDYIFCFDSNGVIYVYDVLDPKKPLLKKKFIQ